MSITPRNLGEGAAAEAGASEAKEGELSIPAPAEQEEANKIVKKFKLRPFNGDTKKLPAPKKSKKGSLRTAGEPEYFLKITPVGYDLMAIYNNGKGVAQKLVKALKIQASGRPGSQQRAKSDKALAEQLIKKLGLPVIHG